MQHVLESSRSNVVIVDDAKQMEKIYAIKDKVPHLKAVIQTTAPYAPYVKPEDGYYRVRRPFESRLPGKQFPVVFALSCGTTEVCHSLGIKGGKTKGTQCHACHAMPS